MKHNARFYGFFLGVCILLEAELQNMFLQMMRFHLAASFCFFFNGMFGILSWFCLIRYVRGLWNRIFLF